MLIIKQGAEPLPDASAIDDEILRSLKVLGLGSDQEIEHSLTSKTYLPLPTNISLLLPPLSPHFFFSSCYFIHSLKYLLILKGDLFKVF